LPFGRRIRRQDEAGLLIPDIHIEIPGFRHGLLRGIDKGEIIAIQHEADCLRLARFQEDLFEGAQPPHVRRNAGIMLPGIKLDRVFPIPATAILHRYTDRQLPGAA